MKDNKLEVGDELYYIAGMDSTMYYAGKIDRVTKTLAFVGDTKYRIALSTNYSEPCTARPGDSGYTSRLYYLLTDEKKIELKNSHARRKLESAFVDQCGKDVYSTVRRLTDSQISRIVEILKEDKGA